MLLEVSSINKSYPINKGIFKKGRKQVLKDVTFEINIGECVGIIGESGSGKSTLGRIILGIEKADQGSIKINGTSSVVFQDYVSSVNPKFRIRDIINEPLRMKYPSKCERERQSVKLLERVMLSKKLLNRYPHELSGGQMQRVCIARAIASNPDFLVLDEAVSSLDAAVQVQILELLKELKQSMKLTYVFITHDLLTITYLCDRVLFFKDGEIVEAIESIHQLDEVKHPYSRLLLKSAE